MQNEQKRNNTLRRWTIRFVLILVDIFIVNFSYYMALVLRFYVNHAFNPSAVPFVPMFYRFAPKYTVCCIIVFALFKLYHGMWRYASYTELIRTVLGSLLASAFHALFITLLFRRMPLSYYIWSAGAQLIFLLAPRFAYRLVLFYRSLTQKKDETVGRVMLIGAGQAGQMILRDVNTSPEVHDKVVCIIDDNPNKWNRYVEGVPIVGGREDILANVEK